MASLGYILMNWAAVFGNPGGRKQKCSQTKQQKRASSCSLANKIHAAIQTEEQRCSECLNFARTLSMNEHILKKMEAEKEHILQILSRSKSSLAVVLEREQKLRNRYEQLELEGAQVRYELDQVRTSLSSKLTERDEVHAQRLQLMEKLLQETAKEEMCKKKEDDVQQLQQIQAAVGHKSSSEQSLLQKELSSLQTVMEMRSLENRSLRAENNALICRLERSQWLENELANCQHRLQELNCTLQMKINSERELKEVRENLQRQLFQSRAELEGFRHQLEYWQHVNNNNNNNNNVVMMQPRKPSQDSLTPSDDKRLSLSQPSRKNSVQDGLMLNIRKKGESVSWMIQLPTSGSSDQNHRRKLAG